MTNPPAQTPAAALAPIPDPLDQAGAASSDAAAAGTAAVDSMAEIGESERDPVGEAEAAVLSSTGRDEEGKEWAAAATPNGTESKKDA